MKKTTVKYFTNTSRKGKKDWSWKRAKARRTNKHKPINIGTTKTVPIARKVKNNVTKSDITLESLGLSFTPTHKRISIV